MNITHVMSSDHIVSVIAGIEEPTWILCIRKSPIFLGYSRDDSQIIMDGYTFQLEIVNDSPIKNKNRLFKEMIQKCPTPIGCIEGYLGPIIEKKDVSDPKKITYVWSDDHESLSEIVQSILPEMDYPLVIDRIMNHVWKNSKKRIEKYIEAHKKSAPKIKKGKKK